MNKQQEFFATFFPNKTKYTELEVNGFMIVQAINGVTKKPTYMLYTMDSFKNYKMYSQAKLLDIEPKKMDLTMHHHYDII